MGTNQAEVEKPIIAFSTLRKLSVGGWFLLIEEGFFLVAVIDVIIDSKVNMSPFMDKCVAWFLGLSMPGVWFVGAEILDLLGIPVLKKPDGSG